MNYKEEISRLDKIAASIKREIERDENNFNMETLEKLIPVVDAMTVLIYLSDKKTEFSFNYVTKKNNTSDHFIIDFFLEDDSKGFTISKRFLTDLLNEKPKRFRFSDDELLEHKTKLTFNAILPYLPDVFYCKFYYAVRTEKGYDNIIEFESISDWMDWIDRDCTAIEPVISDTVHEFTDCPMGGPPPDLQSPIAGRKAIPNAVGVDKQVKIKFEIEKEGLSKLRPRYAFLKDLDVNVDLDELSQQEQMDFEYIYNVLFNRQWERALLECKDFEHGIIMDSSQISVIEVEDDFQGGFIYQNVEEIISNVKERKGENN